MDNWDQEVVDLVQPGFIEFDEDGLGGLGFIAVTGELDCRDADRDGRPGVEFSWQGSDEGDDVSGRGWAALNPDGTLEGHIYFHLGDDSAFRAERLTRGDFTGPRYLRIKRIQALQQQGRLDANLRWTAARVATAGAAS